MTSESELKCVISGSFDKFKPEIDLAIEAFQDLGVTVLAPDTSWLYIPPTSLITPESKQFRPLPSEIGMNPGEIEDAFLEALKRSHFVYVVNPHGYIGDIVSLEIGFAMAHGIPVYAQEPMSPYLDTNPGTEERMAQIKVLPIEEIPNNVLTQIS